MDKPQWSLDSSNLPKPKNYRLTAIVKGYSIISLACFFVYAVLFSIFETWQMTLVCGICAVLWMGIVLLNRRGYDQAAFITELLITAGFSLASSWLLGWNSGFFLLSLLTVPLIFQNANIGQTVKFVLSAAVLAAVMGLLILSWQQASYWVIDTGVLHFFAAANLLITIIILAIAGYSFEVAASDVEQALIQTNRKLAHLATTDPVTNLVNRRIILSRIEQEKSRVERGNKAFSLIMVDVDNFKQVNDRFGHGGGDYVLVTLAELISMSLRKQDEVARWGGDEFLIMLPETDMEGGIFVAEKIRNKIESTGFVYRELTIPVTITLGVGPCEANMGIGSCIRKADQALYIGKQAGKNRVGIVQEV